MNDELNKLTYKDATHKLECSHQYNRHSRVEYSMPCIILKKIPNNRLKVLVFGDRRIKQEFCNGKKGIRYVDSSRVSPSLIKTQEEELPVTICPLDSALHSNQKKGGKENE